MKDFMSSKMIWPTISKRGKQMPDERRCPKCQSENVFRSRRRSLEYLLPFFRPYRCYSCERRFLMLSTEPAAERIRLANRQVSGKHSS